MDSDIRKRIMEICGIFAGIDDPSHFDPGIGRYLEILDLPVPTIPVIPAAYGP